jgi:hypothetical protein
MTKAQAIGGTAVVFVLMASSAAAACDLDGVAGPHRYNPFQTLATTAVAAITSPSRPAARERSTAPRERARDNRNNGGRRSDDGQGYSTYSASTSDTSDGSGTPGDADWIHSARDR